MMRYAKISPEGDYMPPPPANAKAAYATMVYVRATIVEDAGWILARATTIAVTDASKPAATVLSMSAVVCSQCIMMPWEMLVLCAQALLIACMVCIAKLMHVKTLHLAVEYGSSTE